MANVEKEKMENIVETLSNMSVLEMAELKKLLEEKWGVTAAAAAPTVVAAPAQGGAVQEESTDFKVTLESAPADKKIAIIKVVREITGLGLKEAKDLVEGAPKVLKESAPKAEANSIVEKIKAAGGVAKAVGL